MSRTKALRGECGFRQAGIRQSFRDRADAVIPHKVLQNVSSEWIRFVKLCTTTRCISMLKNINTGRDFSTAGKGNCRFLVKFHAPRPGILVPPGESATSL